MKQFSVNTIFDEDRCHARLVSKPDNQCTRKKNTRCNFCNIHEKIWKKKGVGTILNDKTIIVKYDFRLINTNYNITSIKVLQACMKGFIVRKNICLRGICVYARHLCNNIVDCMELENISNISNKYFVSYKDCKNIYWAFHIKTLYNLLKYNSQNPYNMAEIPEFVKNNLKKLKYSHVEIKKTLNKKTQLQQRCVDIFQKIDNLDNYTKCSWFLNLNLSKLKNLYFFIFDMWNYRLNLNTIEKKKYIKELPLFHIKYQDIKKYSNYYKISNIILTIFNRLISEGQTKSDKSTAANWILSALTLVSKDASIAYPWLYQAAYPN